jgi:hypothetical protein
LRSSCAAVHWTRPSVLRLRSGPPRRVKHECPTSSCAPLLWQLFNVANPTMGILFLGVKDSQIQMAAG